MKERQTPIGKLKPGMEVWTPNQGWFVIVKLIRIFDIENVKIYNWETTSMSRRLCGKSSLTVKTRG